MPRIMLTGEVFMSGLSTSRYMMIDTATTPVSPTMVASQKGSPTSLRNENAKKEPSMTKLP